MLLAGVLVVLVGCSSSSSPGTAESGATPAAATTTSAPAEQVTLPKDTDEPLPPTPSPYDALPAAIREQIDRPFSGDLDEMVKHRLIRAGVVFNRTHYYIDKGVQRGMAFDSLSLFEQELNKRLKTGHLKVHVAILPMSRDQLFPALQAGKVDLVAAQLTVTPERQQVADFSTPVRSGVSEVPVTADGVPPIATADDLSGREVFVRRSSSYYASLEHLNADLAKRKRPPVVIKEAPEALEDDDILEMVNAGLVEVTIVDDFMAEFWQQVFKNIHLQSGAAVRTGGEIAVGVRKNSPRLLQAVNVWIKTYGPRTAFGNQVQRRYLENATYVRSATAEAERKKFRSVVKLFETYGNRYNVDYVLMTAQGFQESRLDQGAKSSVGAIGIMQVMPATGKELQVGDIRAVEPNIHAGVKYFRFMVDQYYKDEPMTRLDKGLMTLASYNAGPGRMRQLRREAAKRGLDPNVWFGNVERIASERIGRETVQYVSNIYKYYVAYKLVLERETAVARAKGAATQGR
jgi:membrane-bound lytic murein transglycosylase MltF